MQLKTILNRVQKIKSFVYGAVRWVEGAPSPTLEVELHGSRSPSEARINELGEGRSLYMTMLSGG